MFFKSKKRGSSFSVFPLLFLNIHVYDMACSGHIIIAAFLQ